MPASPSGPPTPYPGSAIHELAPDLILAGPIFSHPMRVDKDEAPRRNATGNSLVFDVARWFALPLGNHLDVILLAVPR